MARFKPAGSSRKSTPKTSKGALVGCIILILSGFLLIFLLMRAMLSSGI